MSETGSSVPGSPSPTGDTIDAQVAGSCADCGRPYEPGEPIQRIRPHRFDSPWRASCCIQPTSAAKHAADDLSYDEILAAADYPAEEW